MSERKYKKDFRYLTAPEKQNVINSVKRSLSQTDFARPSKSIFRQERARMRKELMKGATAFPAGYKTGERIEHKLHMMSRKELEKQKRLAPTKSDKLFVADVLDTKYGEKSMGKRFIKQLRGK
jgi:hypothetical protein